VRAAEETLALSAQVSEPRRFANFDAFLAWQRADGKEE
jgi:hypothetical protein